MTEPTGAGEGGDDSGLSATTPTPPQQSVTPAPATPTEVREILATLPEEHRVRLERTFAMLTYQGPVQNPMLAKMDGQHLHKIIDGVEADSQRNHEDREKDRRHRRTLAYVGLGGFLLISGVFLWAKQGDLLKGILIGFAIFVGGLGAGSRFLRRDSDDDD